MCYLTWQLGRLAPVLAGRGGAGLGPRQLELRGGGELLLPGRGGGAQLTAAHPGLVARLLARPRLQLHQELGLAGGPRGAAGGHLGSGSG